MKTLLKVQAALFGTQGHSTQLADEFAANWLAANPGGRVITRDLATDLVPHLTAERFQSLLAKPEERTSEQKAVSDFSDELIAELQNADEIVFAVPMYNFSVPSTLRAYFNHIARSGITFRYTANGPEGLIKGKKAYVFIARGGFYPEGVDTQTPYLRQFLGFIGLTDVQFVHAEGLAMNEETRTKSLSGARNAIAQIFAPEPEAIAA